MDIQDLLQRYFQNKCTIEEIEYLQRYIQQHGETGLLTEEEWERFNSDKKLPASFSQQLFENITSQLPDEKRPVSNRARIIKWSVAASVLICVSIAITLQLQNEQKQRAVVSTTEQKAEIVAKRSQTILKQTNNSNEKRSYTLSDGSTLQLFPNSTVSYYDTIVQEGKRKIYLDGIAYFDVARDTAHPFMVITSDLTTTALGTSFTIRNHSYDSTIEVQLHTGKVEIHSQPANGENRKVLMAPGELLIYGKSSHAIVLNRPYKPSLNKVAAATTKPPQSGSRGWYQISNQPLANTLDQLAAVYHVNISYDKSAVAGKYFIGKFEREHKVQSILADLAQLNHLKLVTIDSVNYHLAKK